MTENETKELCLNLLQADSEEDVIGLLKKAGYWDEQDVWRFLGDDENNFKTVGSQAAYPASALVEKLINSVDARLRPSAGATTSAQLMNTFGVEPGSDERKGQKGHK